VKSLLTFLVFILLLAVCLKHKGLNNRCELPQEMETRLDLRNAADQRHLSADAQFAEELAYA